MAIGPGEIALAQPDGKTHSARRKGALSRFIRASPREQTIDLRTVTPLKEIDACGIWPIVNSIPSSQRVTYRGRHAGRRYQPLHHREIAIAELFEPDTHLHALAQRLRGGDRSGENNVACLQPLTTQCHKPGGRHE